MMTGLHIKSAVVTGATGFLGRWLVAALTGSGVAVTALIRKPEARVAELRAWMDAHGGDGALLEAGALDLLADDLGLDDRAARALDEADVVYHLAALFDFGLDEPVARRANVDASLQLVRRAAHPGLRRFIHISGYRTEGAPAAALNVHDPASLSVFYRTHGAYEASKMEAHPKVVIEAEAHDVPLTRVSPAIVIGDSRTGETTQYTGLAETLELLWQGKLPALPGSADTWLPVIPVDVVAQVLARLPDDDASIGGHVVLFDDRTPTLPELVRVAAQRMGVTPPRVTIPIRTLAALPESLTGVDREALSFLSEDRYDPRPFLDVCQRLDITLPDPAEALARWVDYLVATRFGAAPDGEGALHQVAGHAVWVEGALEEADAVLFPGVMLHARSFQSLRRALSAPTAAVDLPGQGLSTITTTRPADWTRALLSGAASAPVLVGHSLGTAFALRHAAAHPERVRGLVLVSPFFAQTRARWMYRQAWAMRWLFRAGPQGALLDAMGGDRPEARDAVALLRRGPVAEANARWLSWASDTTLRADLLAALAEVVARGVPVTLIHGSADPLVVDVPDEVERVEIEGTGHYPQLSHPERVAEVIARVIEHTAASPSSHDAHAA